MNQLIVLSSLVLMVLTGCIFSGDTRLARPQVCEETESEPVVNNSEALECPEAPVCQCEDPDFPCGEGEYLSSADTCLSAASLHDWLCEDINQVVFDPCSNDVPERRIIARYGEVHDETAFLGWHYGSLRNDWSDDDHDFTSEDRVVLTYDNFREMPPGMVLTNPSNLDGSVSDDEVVVVSIEAETWPGATYAFVVWMRYDGVGADSEEEGTADVVLGYEDSFSGGSQSTQGGKAISIGSNWTCLWIPVTQTEENPGRLGELQERLAIYHGLVPADGQLYVDSVRFILMTP